MIDAQWRELLLCAAAGIVVLGHDEKHGWVSFIVGGALVLVAAVGRSPW